MEESWEIIKQYTELADVLIVAHYHYDHHFLRDLNFQTRIASVYTAAEGKNMRVLKAAEFAGKKVEMLEALRRELYEKYGDMGTS